MSSDYTQRTVKFGIVDGATLPPTTDLTLTVNYLRSCEITVRENIDKQPIIGGSRESARVSVLGEEPDVRMEMDAMSFYPFYLALGNITGTVPPYTITTSATVPFVAIGRHLLPTESGEQPLLRVWGAKVDSLDLTIGAGEIATYEINFKGKGATITGETISSTIDYSIQPIHFSDVDVIVDGTTLPEVERVNLSVKNDIDRKLSVSTAVGYRAYAMRESALSLEGRITVGAFALSMLDKVLQRASQHTVQIVVNKTHEGTVTGTITLPNVMFNEYPDRLEGIEPYSVEIPFNAIPSTTLPAIIVTSNTILI